MSTITEKTLHTRMAAFGGGLVLVIAGIAIVFLFPDWFKGAPLPPDVPRRKYEPRLPMDTSGFSDITSQLEGWLSSASLEEIAKSWRKVGYRTAEWADEERRRQSGGDVRIRMLVMKAHAFNYEGEPIRAYKVMEETRSSIEEDHGLAEKYLYTIIYTQGIAALRRGEDENCIMCRGESSCILPINKAAIHTNPLGSRLAVKHFTEYLTEFPDDLEVQWLLNLAHMTLGEYPDKVDPKFLVRLAAYDKSELDIGVFRDIGHLAGVNRFNQAGGAIMEDFHGKGLLDIVVTSWDATEHMGLYRNKGDGTFEDRTKEAGLTGQLGGLNCVQTDYLNSGHMDIFVPRGGWYKYPLRPSLLRNNGNGTFTDVTKEAGLAVGMCSACGAWADMDNDGFLDLYLCGERQPSRLYRNKGDGGFEDVTAKAGLPTETHYCKGAAWLDFDNDGYPDLFINYFPDADKPRTAQLFRNNRNGTFTNVTKEMGIDGPTYGFSCWAFDFDNDGWIDIFATSYDRSTKDIVLGMQGKPHTKHTSRLYRNLQGKGFKDVTKEAGVDGCYATMGSNFGDLDNDGYLDFYLGTGEPSLGMLVPNRMFKNIAGKRFAEITTSSRTGHLQKGHGIAIGDWRRTGNCDVFMETGGATNGDKYHNVLFMNPGQGNNYLTVKLIGKKTNRPAVGARIKVVTNGNEPLTVHRHVTSGSSFGANPLQQTFGLAKADKVTTLEVTWPASGTTQVFHNVDVNQAIEITEFDKDYRKLNWKPLPTPKS